MRTKTLILSALLCIAASPLFAQTNVYSVNAVGYVQQPLQPGVFAMIANPLNTTNNTLVSLMPSMPNGTVIYKWNGTGYASSTFLFGSWTQPSFTLNPGEGCFIKLGGAAPVTNTWVGEVLQGNLTNNIPTGFSILSSMVPQTADVTALGLTTVAANGDTVYRYDIPSQGYTSATYLFGSWNPAPPTINVGEAFFFKGSAPKSWVRSFSVNN
jgi:hypothetical protein